MTIVELVKVWWESSDNCSSNCSLCFSRFCCPETTKLICEKQRILESKIKQLVGSEMRVFIVSKTECVVSSWDDDGFDHHLEICSLE